MCFALRKGHTRRFSTKDLVSLSGFYADLAAVSLFGPKKLLSDLTSTEQSRMEGDSSLSKPSDVELILDTNETKAKTTNGSVHYTGQDVVNGEFGSSPEKGTQQNTNGIEEHRNGHHQNGGAKSSLGDEEEVKPAPAESSWTVQADGTVKLLMGSTESTSRVPMTVVQGLQRAVRIASSRVALAVKRNGEWVKWTYSEYYESVRSAAKSFIKVCAIF